MISRLALLGIASLAIVASPALAVGKKKNMSWGKPAVSFAQYRADALDCANLAYGVEVTPKRAGFVGSGFYGHLLPLAYLANVTPDRWLFRTSTLEEGVRYALRKDTIEQLQAVVDSCLVGRGYRQFRLSSDQMSMLRRIPKDAPERQTYLHSLGSSETVLATQAL